jgi:hypothetical protein
VAARLFTGLATLFAVAIFSISIHPIRHSADIKPYASDLLVALVLLALAVEWYRARESSRWLWTLAAFGPIAVLASYPASLVAGGIGLALLPSVWKTGRWRPRLALLTFGFTVVATFALAFLTYMHNQRPTGALEGLKQYWSDSFPPLQSPLKFIRWLIEVHAGSMMAYPGGGRRGGSTATLILVLVATIVLWRRGQKTALALLLAPMAVTLAAAVPRLYPYGGEARVMQFAAPAICLLAGVGLGAILGLIRRPRWQRLTVKAALTGLAVSAVTLAILEVRHPYRMLYDHQVREFARQFWPQQAQGADVACLQWDFGLYPEGLPGPRTALYLCNQLIYCPTRQKRFDARPLGDRQEPRLRCVAYDEVQLQSPEATAWLHSMKARYSLRSQKVCVLPRLGEGRTLRSERLVVFEFEPISRYTDSGVAARPEEQQMSR